MPYSFVQIEQDKSRTIQLSFVALVLFYFFSALILVVTAKFLLFRTYLSPLIGADWFSFLDWPTAGGTFVGAGLASIFHWQYATGALIDSTLTLMGARPANEQEHAEKIFMNVVEEAGVATGGRFQIAPVIIPVTAMNAFALQDFNGRSVIGITQGLLTRLNREQLEAVIAHEAGHIASGDCLSTTVTMSIFKVFDNVCDGVGMLMRGAAYSGAYAGGSYSRRREERDGRFFMVLLVIFILAQLLRFMGYLGSMFISRQREFRADALSVKLTRNPLALAEALHIISARWKGKGLPGQGMDAIFILNPRNSALDNADNFVADIFSTHPPVQKRIGILLDMAHARPEALESALDKAVKREQLMNVAAAPCETTVTAGGGAGMPLPGIPGVPLPVVTSTGEQWLVRRGQAWLGPYDIAAIKSFDWITPDTQVKRMGRPAVAEARQDGLIRSAVMTGTTIVKDQCPRCRIGLTDEKYEEVSVQACRTCGGHLVLELDVLTIVGRRERTFSADIHAQAKIMKDQAAGRLAGQPDFAIYDEKSILCPVCLDSAARMTRRFVNTKYRVEVDKCRICARVWFDKDELEILQCLYELDHPVVGSTGS